VVLDGSDALRVAVREFFLDAIVQRCLVHKERDIKGKQSKRHWGELSGFFTRLRSVQGLAAAQEESGELAALLKRINAEAYRSLQEAGDELLHRLNVPNCQFAPETVPVIGASNGTSW
jgi:transposase-like protein